MSIPISFTHFFHFPIGIPTYFCFLTFSNCLNTYIRLLILNLIEFIPK